MTISFLSILLGFLPEGIFSFLIMNSLVKKWKWITSLQVIIAATISSIPIIFLRMQITDVYLFSMFSIIVFSICFKILFKSNWRTSVLVASIAGIVIVLTEGVTFQSMITINNLFGAGTYKGLGLVRTVPTRVTQVGVLILINYFDFRLEKFQLTEYAWSDLEKGQKVMIGLMDAALIATTLIVGNYVGFVIALFKTNRTLPGFETHVMGFMLSAIVVVIFTTYALSRTARLELYKCAVDEYDEVCEKLIDLKRKEV